MQTSSRVPLIVLLLQLAVHSAHAGCIHIGKSLHLDEESFDDYVFKSDHLVTLVEFSSPWCIWAHPNTGGHGDCATMRQAWDKLASTYNDREGVRHGHEAVSVAEVDCSRFITETNEKGEMVSKESLCQRYNVRSYPTVIAFTGETGVSGKNYTGKHTFDAMHEYLQAEASSLCLLDGLEPGEACTEEDKKFLAQWRQRDAKAAEEELLRLEKIASSKEVFFGASKRAWMGRRINILKQVRAANRPPELKAEL